MKRLLKYLQTIKTFFIRIIRRNLFFVNYIIDSHKFFTRKSQHYIMGNWTSYEKKDYWWNKHNKPQKAKNYRYYKKYYLRAYVNFMTYSFKDARLNYATV